MAVTIQVRRGTSGLWTSTNPVLAQGEFGLETDTSKLKIGDGTTHWTSLSYFAGGSTAGVASFNSRTGAVTLSKADVTGTGLTYTDVGADASGAASTAQAASLQKSANLSDVASVSTARTNLGLGTAATQPSTAFLGAAAAASGDLSGSYPNPTVSKVNGLAVGASPGGTTAFLRADGTWASPPSGSGGASLDTASTDIQPLGTRAAGSKGLAADAGHVHPTTGLLTGTYPGGTASFLRADGTWASPPGGSSGGGNPVYPIATYSGGSIYNVTASDSVIEIGAGGATVRFPEPSTVTGHTFTVKNNSNGNAVTLTLDVSVTSGATFDGAASITIYNQYEWVEVLSDGTNYIVVSKTGAPLDYAFPRSVGVNGYAGTSKFAAASDHAHAAPPIYDIAVNGAGTTIQAPPSSPAGYFLQGDGTWQIPAGGSGGGVTLDTTATDIQPLGTQAAGTSTKAAAADHVHPTTGLLTTAGNLSGLASTATARTNLGLGTAATAAIDATATDIAALGTQAAGATGKVADAGHVHPTTGLTTSFNTRTGAVTLTKADVTGTGLTYSDVSAAPLSSPAFTGTPTAPTATAGTNTTQLATTAFVRTAIGTPLALDTTATDIKQLGTQSAGTSTMAAAADHVHPTTGLVVSGGNPTLTTVTTTGNATIGGVLTSTAGTNSSPSTITNGPWVSFTPTSTAWSGTFRCKMTNDNSFRLQCNITGSGYSGNTTILTLTSPFIPVTEFRDVWCDSLGSGVMAGMLTVATNGAVTLTSVPSTATRLSFCVDVPLD